MKFTKHFYIEGQRIVSLPAETLVKAGKLGDMGENQELLNPKDTTRAGNNGNHPIDWENKHEHLKNQLIANFEELGLTGAVFYSPNNYFNGVRELASLGSAGKSGKVPYGQIKKYYRNSNGIIDGYGSDSTITRNYDGNKAELLQFYYHPDHLGSSNFITNVSGEVYQHLEYFPFGETFIEERNGTEYTSYLYNGKEFDEEIGLYYYGARYYDPRISMWYGVDPLAEKYPSISVYAYVANNPIILIDPDGKDLKFAKNQRLGFKIKAFANLAAGWLTSSTMRSQINHLIKSDNLHQIKETTAFNRVKPEDIVGHGKKEPKAPTAEQVMNKEYMQENNKNYADWKAQKDVITSYKDGTGDGSTIYLNLSKKGEGESFITNTAHEFRHGVEIDMGIIDNSPIQGVGTYTYTGSGDGIERTVDAYPSVAERHATSAMNIVARQINRFRRESRKVKMMKNYYQQAD